MTLRGCLTSELTTEPTGTAKVELRVDWPRDHILEQGSLLACWSQGLKDAPDEFGVKRIQSVHGLANSA